MSGAFGDYAYPFLQEADGYSESCECRFACYPAFHARWEAINGTRQKVGFEEFGTPSWPPRYFLLQHTTWKCYTAGDSPTPTFWEKIAIDPETGGGTTTESDPPFTTCPATSATPVVELETPTYRRTVWTVMSGDEVAYRLEQIEALSKEMTTEQLINMVTDDLPDWAPDDESWPGANVPDALGATAYFVQSGICYQPGNVVWSPTSERLVVPSVWRLAEDETEFYIQRVRFKWVFPHIIGEATFRVEWKEEFLPDGGTMESPTNAQTVDGDETTPESAIFDLTERAEENGENYLCCARFVAAA